MATPGDDIEFLTAQIDATAATDLAPGYTTLLQGETGDGRMVADHASAVVKAYADEKSLVLRPAMVAFSMLTYLATLIKYDAKKYAPLFGERRRIQVVGTADDVTPLVEALREIMPPDFMALFDRAADLCDAHDKDECKPFEAIYALLFMSGQPFHEYHYTRCGIDQVYVVGEPDTWERVADLARDVAAVVSQYTPFYASTFLQCEKAARQIKAPVMPGASMLVKKDKCGSGTKTEFSGLLFDLCCKGNLCAPATLPYYAYTDDGKSRYTVYGVKTVVDDRGAVVPYLARWVYAVTDQAEFDRLRCVDQQ